jgi:hypothetical protein
MVENPVLWLALRIERAFLRHIDGASWCERRCHQQ